MMRFHDLRHGFASLAFAAGVPLKVVSESLGHSGIAITSQTYVHLLDDLKRDKSDRLDAYLDGVFVPATAIGTEAS
jgi:integrase